MVAHTLAELMKGLPFGLIVFQDIPAIVADQL